MIDHTPGANQPITAKGHTRNRWAPHHESAPPTRRQADRV